MSQSVTEGWGTQLRLGPETAARGDRVIVCDVVRQVDLPLCVDCVSRMAVGWGAQLRLGCETASRGVRVMVSG